MKKATLMKLLVIRPTVQQLEAFFKEGAIWYSVKTRKKEKARRKE